MITADGAIGRYRVWTARACLFSFALCQVLGAALFLKGMTGLCRPFFARDWPSARGRIIAVQAREQSPWKSGQGFVFQPILAYEFTVGDSTYTGTDLSFGPHLYSDWQYARQFTPGQAVTVVHHPDNPWECVLSNETSWLAALFVLLGLTAWAGSFASVLGYAAAGKRGHSTFSRD